MVCHGTADAVSPIEDGKKLYKALLNPVGRLVELDDCSHQVMQEQPKQVLDAIQAFLSGETGTVEGYLRPNHSCACHGH